MAAVGGEDGVNFGKRRLVDHHPPPQHLVNEVSMPHFHTWQHFSPTQSAKHNNTMHATMSHPVAERFAAT